MSEPLSDEELVEAFEEAIDRFWAAHNPEPPTPSVMDTEPITELYQPRFD